MKGAPAIDVRIMAGTATQLRRASQARPGELIASASTLSAMARNGVVVRMPATPRYILLALAAARGGYVTVETLFELLFRDRPDGGPESLWPYVHVARTAGVALGLLVEGHKGRGYSLRPLMPLGEAA